MKNENIYKKREDPNYYRLIETIETVELYKVSSQRLLENVSTKKRVTASVYDLWYFGKNLSRFEVADRPISDMNVEIGKEYVLKLNWFNKSVFEPLETQDGYVAVLNKTKDERFLLNFDTFDLMFRRLKDGESAQCEHCNISAEDTISTLVEILIEKTRKEE